MGKIELIGGTEPYLVDCAIHAIKKELGEGAMDIASFSVLDDKLFQFITATPFLMERRTAFLSVMDLKEVDSPLFQILKESKIDFRLVIRFESADTKTSFYKNNVALMTLYNKEQAVPKLAGFCIKHAERKGASFQEGVLDAFLEMENYRENDAITLYNVMSDLNSIISLGNVITMENVAAVSSDNTVAAVFTLISLIKERNVKELMHQARLLQGSEIGALSALLREYRVCYKRCIGVSKDYCKLNVNEKAAAMGIHILTDTLASLKKGEFPALLLFQEALLRLMNEK